MLVSMSTMVVSMSTMSTMVVSMSTMVMSTRFCSPWLFGWACCHRVDPYSTVMCVQCGSAPPPHLPNHPPLSHDPYPHPRIGAVAQPPTDLSESSIPTFSSHCTFVLLHCAVHLDSVTPHPSGGVICRWSSPCAASLCCPLELWSTELWYILA